MDVKFESGFLTALKKHAAIKFILLGPHDKAYKA